MLRPVFIFCAVLVALLDVGILLFVWHRLSSIADIDRIVVFRDREIVGEGDFATLLNTNEYFAELYRASQKSKT